MLKNKYGDDYISHKEEIMYGKVSRQPKEMSEAELYEQLKRNYNKYLQSIDPNEAKRLNIAINIYNSAFFIAINNMTSIQDYQEKSGTELIEECDKKQDFREKFHSTYRKAVEILEDTNYNSEKETLESFGEILDFSSEESLIGSLKDVSKIIDTHKDKITVPQDMFVYRGVATEEMSNMNKLSQSEIISTSLSQGVADSFMNRSNVEYKYLEYILVEKGTPYLLPLNEQGEKQKEIMFFDSAIETEVVGKTFREVKFDQNGAARCYKIRGKEKDRENPDKSMKLYSAFIDESKKEGALSDIEKIPKSIKEKVSEEKWKTGNDINEEKEER